MTASALDRLVNQLICDAETERLRDQPMPLGRFTIQRRARDLAPFAEARAAHHRERAAHFQQGGSSDKQQLLEHTARAQHFAGLARILSLAHPGQMVELTAADVESLQLTA